MNLRTLFAAIFALFFMSAVATAQTASDPNEGSRLTRDPVTGAYSFSWWGVGGRTYFLQESEDLINWTYLPVIESGSEQPIQWGFTSTARRFFVRLKYTDVFTNDPFNDDFDGDGVSNYNELLQGTDPLSAALDTNGLPLDWETFYSVPVGTDPYSPAPRGDGLSYLDAFQQGLDPNNFYNRQTVSLSLVSGDNQSGSSGVYMPNPLVVHVTDAATGIALVNAPVTFNSVTAQVAYYPYDGYGLASTLQVTTDYQGNASVYVKLPASGLAHQITASAVSEVNTAQFVFHANVVGLSPLPQSFNVSVDNGEVINTFLTLPNPSTTDVYYNITPNTVSLPVAPSETPQDANNPAYNWKDSSDTTDGPTYVWNDISVTGTKLANLSGSYYGATQQINLGFGFPFFASNNLSVWICSNGYLNFGYQTTQGYNYGLPSYNMPLSLVAPFFTQLSTYTTGNVYYKTEANKVTVQWDNMGITSGTGTYTFQVVLESTGVITYYYKTMSGAVNTATVGIQDGSYPPTGRQVAFDQPYIHNGLAVRLYPVGIQPPPWVQVTGYFSSGYLAAGQSTSIPIRFSGIAMPAGTYTASLLLQDYYGNTVGPAVPVTMTATGNVLADSDYDGLPDNWERRYFGNLAQGPKDDPDGDGLTNLQEFQQGTDPTDYYNGYLPTLALLSGADQRAAPPSAFPGAALPTPISVQVNGGYDNTNQPVTFTVASGNARIASSADPVVTPPAAAATLPAKTLFTDADGGQHYVAQVYVYLPAATNDVSIIQATVKSGGRTITIATSATATDTSLQPPTNLTATPINSTSVALSWTPGDPMKATTIQGSTDGLNWFTIGVVAPGVSAATITGLPSDVTSYFRVFTGGSYASGGGTGSGDGTTFGFGPGGTTGGGNGPGGSGPGGGPGSNPTSPAPTTPVSAPTLKGEQVSYSNTRWGLSGFSLPDPAPTRYLKEVYTVSTVDDDDDGEGGSRTRTTTVDKETGAQTDSNTGDSGATDWGFLWQITSDTVRTRDGTESDDPDDSSTATDTLSIPYTPDDFVSYVEGKVPAFQNNFTNASSASINLSLPDKLQYSIRKLQYKWDVPIDKRGLLFWDVQFAPTPLPSTPVDTYYYWNEGGTTESSTYTVDPTLLNNKANGSYLVTQKPTDIIQIEAFIPQEYVRFRDPTEVLDLFPEHIDVGDSRKTPLDASFTTGSATFVQDTEDNIHNFRLFETMHVAAFSKNGSESCQSNGGATSTVYNIERAARFAKCGQSQEYKVSDLVNGLLPSTAVPFRTAVGTPDQKSDIYNGPANTYAAELKTSAANPLVGAAIFTPINYDLVISVDRTVSPPTYKIQGTHAQFPAYSIWINGQRIYTYDPIQYGRGPIPGLGLDQDVNENGYLNQ